MLDWTRINMLKDDFGPSGFEEIVEMFAEETREVVMSLDSADDPAGRIHFVKGGAENMGFEELAQRCKRAEQSLGRGEAVDCAGIVHCFEQSFAVLRTS